MYKLQISVCVIRNAVSLTQDSYTLADWENLCEVEGKSIFLYTKISKFTFFIWSLK